MKTNGFTLIEVLVAMLILAVGLLGLATLQTYSLRSNVSAYTRGQATQLLYDMSDRMRANNCKPSTNPVVTCATTPDYEVADTSGLTGSTPCTISTPPSNPNAVICSAAQLATNDLIEWQSAIESSGLTKGKGSITRNSTTGIFTLSITWDDNRSGGDPDADDPTLTMSLQL